MDSIFTRKLIIKLFEDNYYYFICLFSSCSNSIFSKKTCIDKIKCIYNIMSSKTMTKEQKHKAFTLLHYYNKYNNSLTKFQKIFKMKYIYKNSDCNLDLNMNELSNYKDTKKYILIQNKTIYIFYIYDLLNIIKTSLLNSYNLYVEPQRAKNPYTNLLLSDCDLYNIYSFCKMNNININYFTKQYYKVNLDIHSFKIENSDKLFENTVNNYLYYSDNNVLYQEIYDMIYHINTHNYNNDDIIINKIKLITPEEASIKYKNKIVELCKKILFPYFIIIYRCNNEDKFLYYINKLVCYIKHLYKNHKNFWRVKYVAKRTLQQ